MWLRKLFLVWQKSTVLGCSLVSNQAYPISNMEVALGTFEDVSFENDEDNVKLKPATSALEYLRQVQ